MLDNQMGDGDEMIMNSGGRISSNAFDDHGNYNQQEYFEGTMTDSEKLTDGGRDKDMSPMYNEPAIIRSPEMEPAVLNY